MRLAGILAPILILTVAVPPTQACGLLDWLFHRDQQPVVAANPCDPCNQCNPCDPCSGNCGAPALGQPMIGQPTFAQPTTVGFRGPVFRSIFAPVPVTAYRPVAAGPMLSGCQTQTMMVQRVPTTAFRPWWRPSALAWSGAQTSYYAPVYGQTSFFAPQAVQANYAQPVFGRDHSYEGLGPTNVAMPTVAPAYFTQPMGGCNSCNRIPVTSGYPQVMSPTTTVVSPQAAYPIGPSYPSNGYPAASYPANGYPTATVVTTPATNGAAPALHGTSNGAAPASVPANAAPALKPFETQPMAPVNSGSGLVPIGPAASGVNYPKAAVPTPNIHLRPLPDLDPPLPPTVKPAPPLLQPEGKTASLPVQWASRPTASDSDSIAPAVHKVALPPAPKAPAPKAIQFDAGGWRAAQ